jgi:O-antigen ligase/Tfp pilus assembly protein PilF
MASPDRRSLALATVLLAGVLIGLPWMAGGRSPIGQVSLVLLLVLAGGAATVSGGLHPLTNPSPLLLVGAALATVSSLHTIYPDRTIQHLLLLFAYLLAGTLSAQAAREEPWMERTLLAAILISGVLVTLAGLFRLLQGSGEGLYARLLIGPFGYPNAMAGYLLLTGGAALAMAREGRSLTIRAGTMATGALTLAGLLLTRSRGALLAAGVGFVVWALVESRSWWPRRRLWFWLAGGSLLAALTWFAWSVGGLPQSLWGLAGRPGASSLLWRWRILQWTWAMARDHPWWGVGPGAFPVALTRYQRIPYVSGENPHNLYLELAAEYGLPATILAVATLGGFLVRVGGTIRRTPEGDPARGRLAAFLATLVAFFVHSLMDLDWTFPAIATTAATLLGLASAHLRRKVRRDVHPRPIWRGAVIILLLLAAAFLSVTRYYASTFVTWARIALASRDAELAQRDLTWALRLNPLSFPAHHWMAWARLLSDDPLGAGEVAERAIRIAPSDPNTHYLAGEIAAASGRWDAAEDRFRNAVELSPSAQLRFHASLVESAASAGRKAEARFYYDRAIAIFTEERVLDPEARCQMPGDRYLLARTSRIAARTYGENNDSSRRHQIMVRARILAQPDPNGICATRGRPGQTSPEVAMESFWRALSDGGWPQAEQFFTPELRASQPTGGWSLWQGGDRPRRARLSWIAALHGGENQTSLRFEVEIEIVPGRFMNRCARADLRLIRDNWYVERLPAMEADGCQP